MCHESGSKLFHSGQNLLEFALHFLILFLILMGIFDLGRIVFYYSTMTNAAREGA
jgi:Flp pilus assembly protein TadG